MKFNKWILLLLIPILFSVTSCDSMSQDPNLVASVNDELDITFSELKGYHSAQFFERRFPNEELKAYPLALDEIAIRKMKLLDFFEQELHKDSLLMLDLQRTINEELVQVYFDEVFFKNFIEEIGASGTQKSLEDRFLDRALEAFDNFKVGQINNTTVSWNEDVLNQLTKWGNMNNFFSEDDPRYREILSDTVEAGFNPVVMSYADGEIDIKEYHRLLNEVLLLENNSSPSNKIMKDFILEAARTSEIIKEAKQQNLDENIVSIDTPSPVLKTQFIFLYNQVKITDPIPEPTQDNLINFYENQKNDALYQLAKRIVYVSMHDSEAAAEEVWQDIESGSSFEQATNRTWLVRSYIRNRDGEIESFKSIEEPYLGELAFSMTEGEVSGPLEVEVPNEGTKYVVIKCSSANEEKVPEFEEISNLESTFLEFHRTKNVQEVEIYLRENYPLTIYQDNLTEKISQN